MKTKENTIAIVLPVYNTARYLRECLDSILDQTYRQFTVFAVDDGSTDESGDILDEYAEKDSRFVVMHKKNGGVSSARNTALDRIEEEGGFDYISFVDSDDIVVPSFLSDFVEIAYKFDPDYILCGIQQFTKVGPIVSSEEKPVIVSLDKHGIANQYFGLNEWATGGVTKARFLSNKIFRSDCIFGIRFNTKLSSGEDQEFFIKTLGKINKGVCFNAQNYKYRLRASSLTRTINSYEHDLIYFDSMLHQRNLCEEATKGIELLVLDCWWTTLRDTYKNSNEDGKKMCKEIYDKILKGGG